MFVLFERIGSKLYLPFSKQFLEDGAFTFLGSPGTVERADSNAIGNGVSSLAVVFSQPVVNTSYAVYAAMSNVVDTNPQFQPITFTAKATTGFTASWNAPTDSVNYILEYIVKGDN